MSSTMKAVLLSALVFPGAGHMHLKYHVRAALLFITTSICLWIIVSNILDQAHMIINQMTSSGTAIDIHRISELSTQAAANADNTNINIAFVVLFICWLFSIIDSYYLSKHPQKQTYS